MNRRTVLIPIFLLLFVGLAMATNVGGVQAADVQFPAHVDAWMREAKVGPYQEETIDYDELYELAKAEGKVVVYAGTTRMPQVIDEFQRRYPGIELEIHAMPTAETIERFQREQRAGRYEVDVITASQAPRQLNQLHRMHHMLFPWIPPDLRDAIPEHKQLPILWWFSSSRHFAYNSEAYSEQPIESLWELTMPEWRGRIVLGDPRLDGSTLDFFTMVVVKADEMAAEYERVFGEPIKLTTPNAGYEWIKRLFANRPQLERTDREAAEVIGAPGQTNPPIGLVSGARFGWSGDPARGNLQFAPTRDLQPADGFTYPVPISVAYRAPHPNAAKLFIRFLFGDQDGGGGYAPWFFTGEWPSRTDLIGRPTLPFAPQLEELLWPISDINYWDADLDGMWELQDDVLDFLIDHI